MKKPYSIILTVLLCWTMSPLFSQTEYEKYLDKENQICNTTKCVEDSTFLKFYDINIKESSDYLKKEDSLFLSYIEEYKERFIIYKSSIASSRSIIEKVNKVEDLYPKESKSISIIESAQELNNIINIKNKENKKLNRNTINSNKLPSGIKKVEPSHDKNDSCQNNYFKGNIPVIEDIIDNFKEIELEYNVNRPITSPLPKKSYTVSSQFNKDRLHPILNVIQPHEGIDLSASYETKIYATANGVVKESKRSKSAGNWIIIDHQNGYTTTYMHLNKRFVKKGQIIKMGHNIGEVGSTGLSTGNHLHYEIRKNGDALDPLDNPAQTLPPIPMICCQ